jgi:hypothetical protein
MSGHSIRTLKRALVAVILLVMLSGVPVSALAQECIVLDPDLKGHFIGGCRDGLAEGYGEAKGMAIYQGSFRAGMKNGAGTKIWPWGDRYQGEFNNDAIEGEGRYTRSLTGPLAGEEYIGHFVANRRDGLGEYRWSTGERFLGKWQADFPAEKMDSRLYERLIATARAEVEAESAVGKAGVRVCRPVRFGISEQEWIKGVVIAFRRPAILIEVETQSRNPRTLNGVDLVKGARLWDLARDWKPCP